VSTLLESVHCQSPPLEFQEVVYIPLQGQQIYSANIPTVDSQGSIYDVISAAGATLIRPTIIKVSKAKQIA
jgi:hypothetical protein